MWKIQSLTLEIDWIPIVRSCKKFSKNGNKREYICMYIDRCICYAASESSNGEVGCSYASAGPALTSHTDLIKLWHNMNDNKIHWRCDSRCDWHRLHSNLFRFDSSSLYSIDHMSFHEVTSPFLSSSSTLRPRTRQTITTIAMINNTKPPTQNFITNNKKRKNEIFISNQQQDR